MKIPEIDVRQTMLDIPNHFNPEKAKGVSGIVQCVFSGNQASDWVITIEDQDCKVEEGTIPDPDLTIKADAEDGIKVLTGTTDPMRAYMLGKIKVFGDLSLGMKLTSLFDR
jgi:putative sterol carrier protein